MPLDAPDDRSREYWRGLIESARPESDDPPSAQTFIKPMDGYSKSALVECTDGLQYVVKPHRTTKPNLGRPLFTEQIAALLGPAVGAPIPPASVVYIPRELIDNTQHLRDAGAVSGPAHASRYLANAGPQKITKFAYTDHGDNRQRYAALSIFYGWFGSKDQQVLYEAHVQHPGGKTLYRVVSVDHGHFMQGPEWTRDDLLKADTAKPDSNIFQQCGLDYGDLELPLDRLSQITDERVAGAVASPPNEWGVEELDRIYVAHYLSARRQQLTANSRQG